MRVAGSGVEPRPCAVAHLAERGLCLQQRPERQVGCARRRIGRQQQAAGIKLPAADPSEQFV